LSEVENVRALHEYAWLANAGSRTKNGVYFAESRMAAVQNAEILLVDINGGAAGVVAGLRAALEYFNADLLVGLDVGGDSLANGNEPGLRSPLADSVVLAAFAQLADSGVRTLWGVFGYGSDGELSVAEIELALSRLAAAGGLLGCCSLTPKIAAELTEVIKTVPTEASSIPVQCFHGAYGEHKIRGGQRSVRLTPLTTLIFFASTTSVFETLARPARALAHSTSLEQANDALHGLGIRTELDYERALDREMRPQ
jgi:hypothetical protein